MTRGELLVRIDEVVDMDPTTPPKTPTVSTGYLKPVNNIFKAN